MMLSILLARLSCAHHFPIAVPNGIAMA
jgi:hypothetical protein